MDANGCGTEFDKPEVESGMQGGLIWVWFILLVLIIYKQLYTILCQYRGRGKLSRLSRPNK